MNWDSKKKDERDAAREKEKALSLVGKHYDAWKTNLISKPRTRKDIIASLYKLQEAILGEAKYLKENDLSDFTDMTVDIIEKHLATLITAQITASNTLTQHVPVSEISRGAMPRTATFRTREELVAIDFVKHFADQPNFTGFTWRAVDNGMKVDIMIMAHYSTGDGWLVGICVNDVGLEDVPEYTDSGETGSAAHPDEATSAPGSSSAPEAHPPATPETGGPAATGPGETR